MTTRAVLVLMSALIVVESAGNPKAVGARGEAGCLQITQGCIEDVNRINGHVIFSREDCFLRSRSIAICQLYINHYATRERLGHEPTDEDRARIWNGGPNGWKSPATLPYWRKVERELGR